MSPGARRIWITRAEPGASATAARLRAMGHQPLVAPLLVVRPLAPEIDLEGVGALAFTSANGVRAFCALSPQRSLRVFAVGAATAEAAKAAGFSRILSADGDVEALARAIAGRRGEIGGTLLHAGAAEPAGDLIGALQDQGVPARSVAVYETIEQAAPFDILDDLAAVDDVLVHSPRAGKALAAALKGRTAAHLRVLCISKAAAAPLARRKLAAVAFAPFPIEAALLNLIDR